MTDTITLTGVLGTEPTLRMVSGGTLAVTSFRLASTERKHDRATDQWSDGDTSWYSVSAFRQLALNAAVSLKKGDRVIVTGRFKLKAWESKGKSGVDGEIEADAIGHDLNLGTSRWAWAVQSSGGSARNETAQSDAADPQTGTGTDTETVQGWATVTPPDDDSDEFADDDSTRSADAKVATPF